MGGGAATIRTAIDAANVGLTRGAAGRVWRLIVGVKRARDNLIQGWGKASIADFVGAL
jgi:hypothetical protein